MYSMAFIQVKSMEDRKALVDKFLKNRAILKKRIIDEKVGKQRFQEDVAQPLQKPVTAEIVKQTAEIDKKQNSLIEKLQEGQDALALTHAGIVNAIGAIPPALPFRTPEAATLAAGPTTAASPIVEYPIDLKVLEEYGFPNPTYVRDRGVDFMREIMINVDSKLKSLGGMKSTKDVSKKAASKKISALQDYKQELEKYLPQAPLSVRKHM